MQVIKLLITHIASIIERQRSLAASLHQRDLCGNSDLRLSAAVGCVLEFVGLISGHGAPDVKTILQDCLLFSIVHCGQVSAAHVHGAFLSCVVCDLGVNNSLAVNWDGRV